MLGNFIVQVRRPKGVSSERVAFVSRAVQAIATACNNNIIMFFLRYGALSHC